MLVPPPRPCCVTTVMEWIPSRRGGTTTVLEKSTVLVSVFTSFGEDAKSADCSGEGCERLEALRR